MNFLIQPTGIRNMSEWKTYRLGDLCSRIKSGKGIPASEVSTTGEYPVIGGNGIRGYTNTSNFNGVCAVVGRQGAYCGNVRFFSGEAYMTEHAVVIVGNELADTRYLAYLLSIMQLGHLSAQSAQPGLSVQTLSKLSINIPDISTQRRIAGILGSLDDKIELNRRINANLETQAQALFRSWFVDFEPFRDGPFVDSELGKIPQGWKVGTASEFYKNITIGKTPPRKEHQWFSKNSHDIVWVSIADMGNCGLSICNSSEYLTPEAIKKFNICIVPVNTVLLSFKLTIGRVAIADKELATNEAIAHFHTRHNTLEYTYLALKNYEFSSLGSTSSIATAVNSRIIKSMPWMMPSDDVLNQFHNVLSPIFNGIRNNIQEITRLSALRDTLLPKLMTREISC